MVLGGLRQGTVKETLGNVNTPITCAGRPGGPRRHDRGDDDGVLVIARDELADALEQGPRTRVANETEKRARLAAGELGLDMYGMRGRLAEKGLKYVEAKE